MLPSNSARHAKRNGAKTTLGGLICRFAQPEQIRPRDPRRVIAHLPDPFMSPIDHERDGYVPNVLYSCGAMVHNDQLVLPYGFSDLGTGIALVPLNDLLAFLLDCRCDE